MVRYSKLTDRHHYGDRVVPVSLMLTLSTSHMHIPLLWLLACRAQPARQMLRWAHACFSFNEVLMGTVLLHEVRTVTSGPILGLCKALHVSDGIVERFELRTVLLVLLVHSSAHAEQLLTETWDLCVD